MTNLEALQNYLSSSRQHANYRVQLFTQQRSIDRIVTHHVALHSETKAKPLHFQKSLIWWALMFAAYLYYPIISCLNPEALSL